MAPTTAEQDRLIAQFCAITGTNSSQAREFLSANDWDFENAVTDFYPEQDADLVDEGDLDSNDEADGPSAGRVLGDGSMMASKPPTHIAPKKKFATLGDLGSGDGGGGDPNDSDSDGKPDLFAGGEKSGLAVQNPDDIKRKILEKARKTIPRSSNDQKATKSHFTGTARTLGGDDTPSRVINNPNENMPQRPPRVTRTLHFWNDGFSVDDGDLYRSDDPRNAEILDGIRQGRAPLSIMNVQPGQEVDVEVKQHQENYVKPKLKYKPFSGVGQRLGSPTPGPGTRAPATSPSITAAPNAAERPSIDESKPTITLQIRLGDGTRLSTRFNTTQTVGDVYSFVAAASPSSQSRPWVLMTTFPSTELRDKAAILGELKEYKRGGVVVQRWT